MHPYFRFSRIKALLVFFLLSLSFTSAFAYLPASIFPETTQFYSKGLCSAGQNEIFVDWNTDDYRNGTYHYSLCFSCPPDFPEVDYVIVNDTPDLSRPVCQKACGTNEIRSPRYGGAGYQCETCNEPHKEWVDGRCQLKQCPPDKMLDVNTGQCVEPDVTCPPYQEKIYPLSSSKPYCGSFCQNGYSRITKPYVRPDGTTYSAAGLCTPIPKCSINERLEYVETVVKTTVYRDYKCEPIICEPDEELVNGQCIKKQLDACDSESKFYTLCQWYEDWKIWRDDYNWYESEKHEDNNSIKYTLDDIQQQDKTFYDEIRLKLENGELSLGEYPIVQFPAFCEWSTVVCEWYLDYKDFTQEIRDFMDEYSENIDDKKNPLEIDKRPYEIKENDNVDLTTTRYIQGSSGCPINRDIPVSMGGHTINIVISYRSLCDAAVMFKPFVILMSFISGMMIITNTGRRAEVGD
jgi:hypothetical protein